MLQLFSSHNNEREREREDEREREMLKNRKNKCYICFILDLNYFQKNAQQFTYVDANESMFQIQKNRVNYLKSLC